MTIDPQNLTLLCLNAKDHELDESSNALIHKLTGNPANDDPIRLELGNITAERAAPRSLAGAISRRRSPRTLTRCKRLSPMYTMRWFPALMQ
jgi:hypothetical protein